MTSRTRLIMGALILLGSVLRLWGLDAMEFKLDEVQALSIGMQLLHDRPWASSAPWPAVGMLSSNSIANAPLFNWIMALFWTIGRSPVGATALVALTNCLCLYPLFAWARRQLDDRRALLVLAYAAVSPFAVIYSRKLWAQDLLLPGLVCVLWAVEWLRVGRAWRSVTLLAAAFLLVGQLHQSGPIALALLPIAIAIHLWFNRPPSLRALFGRPSAGEIAALAIVVGLNLFFWLPYLSYVVGAADALAQRPTASSLRPELFLHLALQVIPQDLFHFFLPSRGEFWNESQPVLSALLRRVGFWGAVVLGVPLALYGIARWLIRPQSVPVLGVWWLLIIAAFALARMPTYPHYVLILAPLPALLMSGAFDGGRPLERRMARWVTGGRVLYLASLCCLTVGTLSWLAARGGADGDYGIVYRERVAQAEAVLRRERPADAPVDLVCSALPGEVAWLAHWKAAGHAAPPSSYLLCDGWQAGDGRVTYRWTVRDTTR